MRVCWHPHGQPHQVLLNIMYIIPYIPSTSSIPITSCILIFPFQGRHPQWLIWCMICVTNNIPKVNHFIHQIKIIYMKKGKKQKMKKKMYDRFKSDKYGYLYFLSKSLSQASPSRTTKFGSFMKSIPTYELSSTTFIQPSHQLRNSNPNVTFHPLLMSNKSLVQFFIHGHHTIYVKMETHG